jgi:hypothetical protein
MSLTTIGHRNENQASRASSVLTLPRRDGYEDDRNGGPVPRTWLGCERNYLVSVSPGQLLRENDICLLSKSDNGIARFQFANKMTYEFALCVQPELPLPPPLGPVLESVEFHSRTDERRAHEVYPGSSVDHPSFTPLWGIQERRKEKLREVKMPYKEFQLWASGLFLATYQGHWFQKRGRSHLPWDHSRKGA